MKITIIGGGPGGYVAALKAAILGAEVHLVEKDALGGTCLNRGCIPTKAFLSCTDIYDQVKKSKEFGVQLEGDAKPIFADMVNRKNVAVGQLVQGVGFLMKKRKVNVHKGTGKLISATEVEVTYIDGKTEILTTDKVIIATGSVPVLPPMFKFDGDKVISSDECLNLVEVPESMIIVGGGVIGCEFGQFLSKLGTKMTIVEMQETLLPLEDPDVSGALAKKFAAEKIDLKLGIGVNEVLVNESDVTCALTSGETVTGQKMLVAIGRKANIANIGLEELGIQTKNGKIVVDDKMRTNLENVYAIGDIVDTPFLAHVASKEGLVAVEDIMGREVKATYHAVPRCVYTDPEVAAVGMTEKEAKEQGLAIQVGKFAFVGIGKAVVIGKTDGFVKIIVDESDKIIGGAIVGPHATDLLAELTLCVQYGLTATQLGEVIHPHPTLSESLMEAAHAVHKEAVHGF